MGGFNSSLSSAQVECALTAALKQEFNVSQKTGKTYLTLSDAIADVTDDIYKVPGLVLTYNTGFQWESKRYNGVDSIGFNILDNWSSTACESCGTITVDGESGDVVKEIKPNTFYKFGECTSLNLTLGAEEPGIKNEYMFYFETGDTFNSLEIAPTVSWIGGKTVETNKKYMASICNGLAVIGGA